MFDFNISQVLLWMFLVLYEWKLEFHDWRLEDLFFYLSLDNVWKVRKKCKQETCFEFIRQHIKCETKIFIIMQTFNLLKWVSAKNLFFCIFGRYLTYCLSMKFEKKSKQKESKSKCCLIIHLLFDVALHNLKVENTV